MKTTIRCVQCKGSKYAREGFRVTANRGKIQKFKCLSCGKYFTNDDGFYRMRTKPSLITMSIDMYLSNLSSRKMRNQLHRHMKTKRSHVTILAWVRKYVLRIQRFVESLKPQLKGLIYADETEIKRGRQNDVFWCAVDWDSRFIPATLYSPNSQNIKDAVRFFKKIKDKATPYMIQTDALPCYPKAFGKVFLRGKWDNQRTGHKVNNVSKTKRHNVRIETVFSKIKDRTTDFRSLKALWSAPILLAGIVIQHNFIEKHSTTGRVPCELAGIPLNLGRDRWKGLIRLASLLNLS